VGAFLKKGSLSISFGPIFKPNLFCCFATWSAKFILLLFSFQIYFAALLFSFQIYFAFGNAPGWALPTNQSPPIKPILNY